MPSIRCLGQPSGVSGDDLFVPMLLFLGLRILQAALLTPVLIFILEIDITSDGYCRYDHLLPVFYTYWSVSVVLLLISFAVELALLRTSLKGAPTQMEARDPPQTYLWRIKLGPQTLLRVTAVAFGAVSLMTIEGFCDCEEEDGAVDFDGLLHRQTRCRSYMPLYRSWYILFITHITDLGFSIAIYVLVAFKVYRPRQHLHKVLRCRPVNGLGWRITCRVCCSLTSILTCCLFGGVQAFMHDFSDIALLLADFTGSNDDDDDMLDATSSDIVAGLTMVLREQRAKREECRAKYLEMQQRQQAAVRESGPVSEDLALIESGSTRTESEHPDNSVTEEGDVSRGRRPLRQSLVAFRLLHEDTARRGSHIEYEPEHRMMLDARSYDRDRRVIAEGAHFMRLALAIYGYIMHMIDKPCTGPCYLAACSVACQRSCCSSRVVGDVPCGLGEIAMLRMAGLDTDCLAYASFRFGLNKTPYAIVIDHDWKSIVVVIRGTLSLENAITDLTLKPEKIDHFSQLYGFDGDDEYCHCGMVDCAEWVYKDIADNGVLDGLLRGDTCKYPHYNLYIVGHSLGAGCAAILSIMMRSQYPNLKCLCFEPPGCVLTQRSAEQDYITSYIIDNDIVPRLSLHAMENLRDDVLEMILRIKVNKSKILLPFQRRRKLDQVPLSDLIHRRSSIPDSEFKRQFDQYRNHRSSSRRGRDLDDVLLVIPGKHIVHLVPLEGKKRNNRTESAQKSSLTHELFERTLNFFEPPSSSSVAYSAVWAKRDDFAEIQLTSNCVSDHQPQIVLARLEDVAASYDLVPPYNGHLGGKGVGFSKKGSSGGDDADIDATSRTDKRRSYGNVVGGSSDIENPTEVATSSTAPTTSSLSLVVDLDRDCQWRGKVKVTAA